jgi:hypothetical protein
MMHGTRIFVQQAQQLIRCRFCFQMLKSFTPVVVMLTLHFSGVETMSIQVAAGIGGIAIGTLISSEGDVSANFVGLLLFAMSSVSEAARVVITQYVMQTKKLTVFSSMYYLAPMSSAWLLLLACYEEIPTLYTGDKSALFAQAPLTFFAAGVLAIMVSQRL